MGKPFIFFDLGQTLIDECDFIRYFDQRFLELLNGFGARIDQRNYLAVRDSVIRDRKIGYGGVNELVIETCKLLSPPGYGSVIEERLKPEIRQGRRQLFRVFKDAPETLRALESMNLRMGLIANQSEDVLDLLEASDLGKYFGVKVISSIVKIKKPDRRIFEMALEKAGRPPSGCVMIGDRLDTDICPANELGMITIRSTNSLFSLQESRGECETAQYTAHRLLEIPGILEKIIG
jgi:HAD superfamily hydrolase (TIGR01549 family)